MQKFELAKPTIVRPTPNRGHVLFRLGNLSQDMYPDEQAIGKMEGRGGEEAG